MPESFSVSGNLLFVKDSLIQFVSSGKQNVLSFRILTFLTVASETCWEKNLLLSLNFPCFQKY